MAAIGNGKDVYPWIYTFDVFANFNVLFAVDGISYIAAHGNSTYLVEQHAFCKKLFNKI
jgi:hypothetical protein